MEPDLGSFFGLTDVTPKWLNMEPRELYIQGETMIVSSDYDGLLFYDISVPEDPRFVKWVGLHSRGELVFKDGYAYTLPVDGEMEIVDIDPPETAHVASTLDVQVFSRDMELSGDNLFLITREYELAVFDVSQPGTAIMKNTSNVSPYRNILTVHGNYLYSSDSYGTGIFDISNPDSPTLVRTIEGESFVSITIAGNYGYAITVEYVLAVIDISDPPTASVVKKTDIKGPSEIVIDGDTVYQRYANVERIQLIDISDPVNPAVIDNLDTIGIVDAGGIKDGYLFCFGRIAGLEIFDIDPYWEGTMVKRLPTLGDTSDIAVQNGIVCTADHWGLSVIDTSPVGSAEIIASHLTMPCNKVTMDDNYVYFTYDGPDTLLDVYDYINLGSNITGYSKLGHSVRDLDSKEGFVYAAAADGGLYIVNATIPTSPDIMQIIDTGERTTCVKVYGDYVYAVDSKQGLTIIDVSNPLQPTVTGNHPISGGKEWTGNMHIKIAVENGLAFVSSYDGYTSPVVPCMGDDFSSGGGSFGGRSYYYTGKYIDVFDVSNPASPTLVGTWDLNEVATTLEMAGPYLLKGDAEGLKIIDITGTSSELVLDSYTGVGRIREIKVEGDYAYVSSGMGFRIIHLGTLL